MNEPSGLSYIKQNEHPSSEEDAMRKALANIASIVSRDIIEMLHTMFDGIDDSFFELANNAHTNNEQNQFFEAMRDIRIKRKNIEKDFTQTISRLFSKEHVYRQAPKVEKPNFSSLEGLTLVKNDDLEEDVAITSMATKAQSNFQGPLLHFHARISKLYGANKVEDISSPLNPKELSIGFSQACANLEIELKERLIVYKQFDRYVLSNLNIVLEEANKTLIRLGIIPDFKTSDVRGKQGPKSESLSSPVQHANTTSDQNQTETSINAFPQLQTLLANIRSTHNSSDRNNSSSTPTPFHESQPTQLIETKDLISLLNAIQNASKPSTQNQTQIKGQAKIIDIHSELKNRINLNSQSSNKNPAFNQTNDDLINLVAMLFEFILEDYNLAAPIQVLISRLQIPILKVVIKDSTFFNSSQHPARQLLNSLAKAGIGWGELQNNAHDALYEKIHQTVYKILDEFNGDISFFDTLNKEFNVFINKEDKKSKIVEQRTKEAETGQAKTKQAQRVVEAELHSISSFSTHPIPELISNILKNGWSRVMFLAFLKDEKEHQWEKVCQTAKDLIWCLQPLTAQKDRQRWIAIAPKLLKDLKSGLEEVSYNSSSLDQTITDIRSTLTSIFKNANFNSTDQAVARQPSPEKSNTSNTNESAVEKQLASKDTNQEKYLTIIEQLKPGTWLEFTLLNGNKYRCKLSAIISEADCFIFVNRMGLKTVEKTKTELTEDLRKKQVIVLEQGLMIDRALTALTSSLRKKASA